MRRRRLGLALAAGGAAAALGPSGAVAQAPASARVAAAWTLDEVLPGQQTIVVYVQWGGCQNAPDAVARETATSVTIDATVARIAVPPDTACPDVAVFGPVDVPLARPLGGRPIQGPNETWAPGGALSTLRSLPQTTPAPPAYAAFTPGFVGLAPLDALRLALAYREPVRIVAGRRLPGRPRIVSQTPGPGTTPITLDDGLAPPLPPLRLVMSP